MHSAMGPEGHSGGPCQTTRLVGTGEVGGAARVLPESRWRPCGGSRWDRPNSSWTRGVRTTSTCACRVPGTYSALVPQGLA